MRGERQPVCRLGLVDYLYSVRLIRLFHARKYILIAIRSSVVKSRKVFTVRPNQSKTDKNYAVKSVYN